MIQERLLCDHLNRYVNSVLHIDYKEIQRQYFYVIEHKKIVTAYHNEEDFINAVMAFSFDDYTKQRHIECILNHKLTKHNMRIGYITVDNYALLKNEKIIAERLKFNELEEYIGLFI